MNEAKPIFDPATHYRIEIRGRIDVEWLQSFGGSAEMMVDEDRHSNEVTVLDVITDQAGIVGLVRRLHGLGITIQQFQVIQAGSAIAPGGST
jgi:hypothetical protein